MMDTPSFVDMTVSVVILTIAYLIATKVLPNAFDRIMQEFKAKRDEFLHALENERLTRASDRATNQEFTRLERESFLQALKEERESHSKLREEQNKMFLQALKEERESHSKLREEQNKMLLQSIEKLQTHLDMYLVQVSGRIGDLTIIVGNLVQMTSKQQEVTTRDKKSMLSRMPPKREDSE